MPWIALCQDNAGAASIAKRREALQVHLDYIDSIRAEVLVAGPLNLHGAAEYNGSLFVYATDDEATARRLLERDPYFIAGIFSNVTITRFTAARGTWLRATGETN